MPSEEEDVPEASPKPEITDPKDADAPLILQGETLPPAVPTPAALTRAFRLLPQFIPGFTQLTVEEERSMIRASHLDPEFLADGMLAADAWERSKAVSGMTAEELHELETQITQLEELYKQYMITGRGILGAIRTYRHRHGLAILDVYQALGREVKSPENSHLRPYYERMKKSYMKNRRTKKKPAAKATAAGEPATPETPEE